MAETPRDHATLDAALKKQDKKYYTDELLGRLTLNDKQFAYVEPENTDPGELPKPDDTSGYVLNPTEEA
jgi:hypothetical protein